MVKAGFISGATGVTLQSLPGGLCGENTGPVLSSPPVTMIVSAKQYSHSWDWRRRWIAAPLSEIVFSDQRAESKTVTHTERVRMNEGKGELGGMGWEGKEKQRAGNSLVVQWLGLDAFFAGAWAWSLVRELRSHKLCDVAKLKNKEKQRADKPREVRKNKEAVRGGDIFVWHHPSGQVRKGSLT